MNKSRSDVQVLIEKEVDAVTKSNSFSGWLSSESPSGDGLISINNSFIYRDLVHTRKNELYLCASLKDGKALSESISVANPRSFDQDFKFFKSSSKAMPETRALPEALETGLANIGQLVFILIGEIEDTTSEVEIDHSYAHLLRFDPNQKETAFVSAENDEHNLVLVNELIDPEAAWNEIEANIQKEIGDETEGFQAAFSVSFSKLQQQALSRLTLPTTVSPKSHSSFLTRVRTSVKEQRTLYEEALRKTQRSRATRASHRNEVLRIAYSFADDAINVLTLLVSICDLKGAVLWCTLRQHFELAEAFRELPWTKIKGKASLKLYKEVINAARNRAFHNLLGFDRSLFSDLTGITIKARSLTLLPAYGRRKTHIPFDYEDRELVEVLSQLSLAPETVVSMEFWNRNTDVMRKFEELLEATESALWLLNAARK